MTDILEKIIVFIIIIIIGIVVIVAMTKYRGIEKTAERYRKAVEICGEGNVIQEGRIFDCEDFLRID